MIVYCIHNIINGKKYIGSDSKNDPKYLGSGVYIKKAIKKYGKENFIKYTLAEVDSCDIMKELEEYWIDYFDAYNNNMFYNATKYSSGITKFPEDKKINISLANKNNTYHKGYKQTEFQKSQTSKANTGRKHSDISNKLKRQAKIGNKYALGNKLSEEQKKKISQSKKNHPCYNNVERNKKISEKNSKPILQFDKQGNFIQEWPNAKSICLYLSITSISRSLKDWNNNSRGFKFKYK